MRKFCLVFLFIPILAGCTGINKDITVADGETVGRDLSTVNGSIRIGVNAAVEGSAETVNGSIELAEGASAGAVETVNGKVTLADRTTVQSIEAVNGPIRIGAGAQVRNGVETVNGVVTIGADTEVGGSVSAVNGRLTLSGANVGSLDNVAGGMEIESGSVVRGELRVRRAKSISKPEPATVIIHADARVVGPLVFERDVDLRIHEAADVGEIRGAEPEYFDD